jgi:hypothetical protein
MLASVALLVIVASSAFAQSTLSGGWVLGTAGEGSCDNVCASLGKTCSVAPMQAINPGNFGNVNTRLESFVCDKYPPNYVNSFNPSYNTKNRNCNRDGAASTCAGASVLASLRRICCCGDSASFDCPVGSLVCSRSKIL